MLLMAMMATEAADADEFEFLMLMGRADVAYKLRLQGNQITVVRQPAIAQMEGQTIGLFRMAAAPGVMQRLASLTPASVPAPGRVFPDSASAQVRLKTAKGVVTLGAPKPSEAYDAIAKLREEVAGLVAQADKHPLRALRVERLTPPVGRLSAGQQGEWKVRLTNPGVDAIAIDWKRTEIQVEGFVPVPPKPGVTPLPPMRLRISEKPVTTGPATIAAQSSVDVMVTGAIPTAGHWMMRAVYYSWAETSAETKWIGGRAASPAIPVDVH